MEYSTHNHAILKQREDPQTKKIQTIINDDIQ